MRAWIVSEFGETSDVLKLDESAESFAPGPAQVKVKVEVAGLGLPDILMCRNNYPLVPPLPFTPSQEAVGEIVAVGTDVDSSMLGRRALGPTLKQWNWFVFGRVAATLSSPYSTHPENCNV
jgi:NADPH:quinone reductase